MSLPSPPPGRERQRSHPSREGVGGEGEGTEDGRARKEKHQRHLDAFFMVQSSSFSRDERLKIAREKERKTHRREGSRGEDDEGKRRKRRIAIGAKGNDESYDLDDEEEVNIVIERNDELEERRRREKNRVVKRWATLAEMIVRNARKEGKKEESASQRIERLVQMAYAYRCKDKVERNSRLRGYGAKPGVRFSLSEGGLLEQRRALHNKVLHDIAQRQTMGATSQMWLPRDQTAQWMGSAENVFSCVEFDRFSGGRFLACAGSGGTVSVHRTSDVNQKSAGGDADSLLSSIYAPVYKKFVAGPVDGVLWVKEGVLATVSRRSDRITFHDVERGRNGASSAPSTSSIATRTHVATMAAVATTTTSAAAGRPTLTSTLSPSPRFRAYSQGLVVTPTNNVLHPFEESDMLGIFSIASCDDGNRLFAATGVGSVFAFDLRQRVDHTSPVAIFNAPTKGILNCVNVTNDSQLICAASSSGRVVLWDARKSGSADASNHRGFHGVKPRKDICSWSVSNMFSKIEASKSEVHWVDFDPKDYSRVAFHCSNGRTGIIDMKRTNHSTSSLGVITHAHCPPNPWEMTTQTETEVVISSQTETEVINNSQIAKWNGRDKRTCSWSIDGEKLIVPNVNDSGIRILDVMANNPKSYQWDKDEDYHYPGHGHEPIAPPLCGQETILSAVAAHPTCDFEYCAGGPNTLSYFRFRTYK